MDFREKVYEWFFRGVRAQTNGDFLVANEMMHIAFRERRIQPIPFRSMIRDVLIMRGVHETFEDSVECHEEIISVIPDEDLEVGDFSNLITKLGSLLARYDSVCDINDICATCIFFCRYAVLQYERGKLDIPLIVVFIISGMASAARAILAQQGE